MIESTSNACKILILLWHFQRKKHLPLDHKCRWLTHNCCTIMLIRSSRCMLMNTMLTLPWHEQLYMLQHHTTQVSWWQCTCRRMQTGGQQNTTVQHLVPDPVGLHTVCRPPSIETSRSKQLQLMSARTIVANGTQVSKFLQQRQSKCSREQASQGPTGGSVC